MKFTTAFIAASAFVASISAVPVRRDVDPALVPEFGLSSGLNPTGTGDCDGINGPNGQPIKIPCACPPERGAFLQSLNANVNAGRAVNNPGVPVSFPTDNSKESQIARIQAALVTLQNLNGPGAGLNPTGTGDCDGIPGPDGKPIKVPCACPPDRNSFIQSLSANVAAGHAVNNPSVALSFPTGNSNADKAARINASLITLQNLRGPGVGCPAASTTLLAQLKAVQ
uniref:Uncharacterized protein n=1 Tax=Moniliophthora roreri TaxID=221103 RepID=A0A0W0GAE6_MONRR